MEYIDTEWNILIPNGTYWHRMEYIDTKWNILTPNGTYWHQWNLLTPNGTYWHDWNILDCKIHWLVNLDWRANMYTQSILWMGVSFVCFGANLFDFWSIMTTLIGWETSTFLCQVWLTFRDSSQTWNPSWSTCRYVTAQSTLCTSMSSPVWWRQSSWFHAIFMISSDRFQGVFTKDFHLNHS